MSSGEVVSAKTALNSVSVSMPRGAVYGLVGHRGLLVQINESNSKRRFSDVAT